MSRIAETFERLRAEGRPGLVIYLTAGDPDGPTSARMIDAAAGAGADIIEVGVPFSDPIADGPVIQRATERALAAGGGLERTFEIVASLDAATRPPIVLFTYANPVVKMGLSPFAARAKAAGVDGVLLLDLPVEEAGEAQEVLGAAGLDLIFLVSPTTTDERLARAAALGRGFLYAISRTGVTGARADLAQSAAPLVDRIRKASDLPVALGFGISTAAQVRAVTAYADAAVVGSAVVQAAADAVARSEDPAAAVGSFVAGLRAGAA